MAGVVVAESDSAESLESMDVEDNNNAWEDEGRFQSHNKLVRFLPYADKISDEADRDIAIILKNLNKAVVCRDLQIAAQLCTGGLNS
jgi:hypothetical protein